MKIRVIGVGVVGGAVKQAFEKHFEVLCYDAYKEEYRQNFEVLKADMIFVCVPTPTNQDGSQDLIALTSVCNMLWERGYQGIVINKCTCLPGTTNSLSQKFLGLKIIHYPEFLTEAHAYDDFVNQKFVILGGKPALDHSAEIFPAFYALNPSMDIKAYVDASSTELIKYIHNSFLATKVEFFNEVYDLCHRLGIEYDTLLAGMHLPGKIGTNHTKVPGPDGKRGFGGMCFPKDTKALSHFAKQLGVSIPLLDVAIAMNGCRRQ